MMAYTLDDKLVIGLASSALFDLEKSDQIFREKGEEAYRQYQRENQDSPLEKGVAYLFIKKLLLLNNISDTPLIEVILFSRNDPDTGLRVMKSIEYYGLDITRAVFLQGKPSYPYFQELSVCLFLSANEADVKQAMLAENPAGRVLKSNSLILESDDDELRIAFDFDGVLIDDEAEKIYQENKRLTEFHEHEANAKMVPHNAGPLKIFLEKLSIIQKLEQKLAEGNKYKPKLRISIVTARNAPAHERAINTMREWDIVVNDAFFLGGIEKSKVLSVLKPHIFFDDQKLHLTSSSDHLPCVHIPFGIANAERNDAS